MTRLDGGVYTKSQSGFSCRDFEEGQFREEWRATGGL